MELWQINTLLETALRVDANTITWLIIIVCLVLAIGCFLPTKWCKWCKPQKLRGIAPALMVSAGIIGTFWGTFIALVDFQTGIVEGGLGNAAMIESIGAVLAGMKTAFITTLIGLFSAFSLKLGLQFLPEPKDKFELIEKETVRLLWEIKDGISGDNKKSLSSRMNTGFNQLDGRMEGLAEAIKDSLVENMKNLMKELRSVIVDQLTEQLKQTNDLLHTQLSKMLDRIEKALIDQFGETFKQFNEATQAIKKWQEDHREQVEQLTKAFKAVASGIEQIRAECKSIPDTMERLKTLMGELDERLKAFSNMKETAEQSFPVIKKHLDAIGNNLQNSASGFESLETTIKATAEAVKKESDNMMQASQQAVDNTQSTLEGLAERVVEKMDGIAEAWGARMVGIADEMERVVNRTNGQRQ